MFETSLVVVLVIITLADSIIIFKTRWQVLPLRQRRQTLLIFSGHIVLLASLAYLIWPLSAPGREPALQTIDEFMTALRSGDYESALQMTTQDWGEDYAAIAAAFQDEKNQPVAWKMTGLDPRNISTGIVTFSDGTQLPVVVGMEWQWEQARWGISGVELSRDASAGRINFWLYDSHLPYSWVKFGVLIGAGLSATLSQYFLTKVRQKYRRSEPTSHPA